MSHKLAPILIFHSKNHHQQSHHESFMKPKSILDVRIAATHAKMSYVLLYFARKNGWIIHYIVPSTIYTSGIKNDGLGLVRESSKNVWEHVYEKNINNMNNQNSMSEWFNRNIVEKVCSHSKHTQAHGEIVAEYTNGTPLVVYYIMPCTIPCTETFFIYVCFVIATYVKRHCCIVDLSLSHQHSFKIHWLCNKSFDLFSRVAFFFRLKIVVVISWKCQTLQKHHNWA